MKRTKMIIAVLMCVLTLNSYSSLVGVYAYGEDIELPECINLTETEKDGYIDIDFNEMPGETSELISDDELQCAGIDILPSSYNSKTVISSSIKNQYSSSCCWAFAAATATELAASRLAGKTESFAFSPAHLAWFTYTPVSDTNDIHYGEYYNTSTTPYNTGGNWLRAAATMANFRGLNLEESYPFIKLSSLSESVRYTSDSGYVIKDAVLLTSEESVKNWIMEYGCACVSYYTANTYYNSATSSYYGTSSNSSNHAITIVGWDDAYDKSNFKTTPSNNGAWLCQNSYGASYGNGGYIWLSYEDTSLSFESSFAGFTVQENVFKNNYSYNNIMFNGYIPMSKTATFANEFTAKTSKEAIKSVLIASTTSNTGANIKVYTGVLSKPDSGKLVSECNVVLETKGYHTVELPEKIHLEQGQKFSIVVTFTGTGTVGVPIENANSTTAVLTANAGESFIKSGTTWIDMTKYSSQNLKNFYIQALTVFDCVHSNGTETVPSTCQKAGYEKVYCKECGTTISYTEYTVLPHNEKTETVNPTCVAEGYERTYCQDCKAEISRTVLPTIDHLLESKVTRATCIAGGYTTHSCYCGYTYTDEFTDPIGHNWVDYDWRIATSGPTIDHEDGKTIFYMQFCTHCGKSKIVEQSKNFWQRLIWFFTHLFQ